MTPFLRTALAIACAAPALALAQSPADLQNLRDEIAKAAALSSSQVNVALVGVPSSWVMEGGEIMPPPGSEEEKRRQHS